MLQNLIAPTPASFFEFKRFNLRMKILAGKLNFVSAVICLLAAVFALDVVSINHNLSDQGQTKVVEFDLEECTAFAERCRKRESRSLRQVTNLPLFKRTTGGFLYRSQCRFFCAPTERDQLNGFGGFLRT